MVCYYSQNTAWYLYEWERAHLAGTSRTHYENPEFTHFVKTRTWYVLPLFDRMLKFEDNAKLPAALSPMEHAVLCIPAYGNCATCDY